MKNLYWLLLVISVSTSCNNGGTKYQPKSGKISPQEQHQRDSVLDTKQIKDDSFSLSEVTANNRNVKLTIVIPESPYIGIEEGKLIYSRLLQLLTRNGITGIGGDPKIIIAPIITILNEDVTATVPTLFYNTYEVTFYSANSVTGDVFASQSVTLKGVGESKQRAFMNAFQSLKTDDKQIQKFLLTTEKRVVEYYSKNCNEIISEAAMLTKQKKYDEATSILVSVPASLTDCYKLAEVKLDEVFQQSLDNNCDFILSEMKAELGKYNEDAASGYNESAMAYYSMIPAKSKCYKEAEQLYKTYTSKLKPGEKQKWEQKKSDNEFRVLQENLKAKVAVEGQSALLEKYKKDFEYDKLPWLRKLIHLGNYDPFDGYSKTK